MTLRGIDKLKVAGISINFKSPFKIIIAVILITTVAKGISNNHNSIANADWIEKIDKIDGTIENKEVKYKSIENNESIRYYGNDTLIAINNLNEKGKTFRRDYYDENGQEFASSYYDINGGMVAYSLNFKSETVTIPFISASSIY
jgi:hypothetical protein